MISNVDKLLLTSSQQAEVERSQKAYQEAQKKGDAAGMKAAHQRAEAVRAQAGYSGGTAGDSYHLLKTANAPEGYNAYEALVDQYAGSGINAIAAGYENAISQLDTQRKELEAQGETNQQGARSAAWNTRRLASEGLLTRGLENTGLADVITATALNQAAANAYQALLDRQNDLQENDAARVQARTDALSDAAELQQEIGAMLGDAYSAFYENEADRQQEQLLQKDAQAAALSKQNAAAADALKEQEKDYYYELALQKLKRQWQLEDAAKGL